MDYLGHTGEVLDVRFKNPVFVDLGDVAYKLDFKLLGGAAGILAMLC
jgi:hypothetical protein